MKMPGISTFVIVAQLIVIVICIGLIGWMAYQNWFIKSTAKMIASQLGFHRAQADFQRQRRRLYEIKLVTSNPDRSDFDDDVTQPTGKSDGPYEVYALLTSDAYPASHIEIRQALIDGYNLHTHQLYEKPEWFDANGFRVTNPKTTARSTTQPK